MRIAVVGAGGIGGYFGGRLAQAGLDVTFIVRGKDHEALLTHGLRVESVKGDFMVERIHATRDPAEAGPVDAVLIAVKAWQVPEVAGQLSPLVERNTAVIPLQNGVEAPDQLAAVLGPRAVLGGLCKNLSYRVKPGHVRHTGADPQIIFGELDNRKSGRVERLTRALGTAEGMTVEVPDNIRAAMWTKFVCVASVSGVGAVARVPLGEARKNPETRSLLEKCAKEIATLALARGVVLASNIVEECLSFVDSLPADAISSMHRDILEGRPSELEAQNGAVVRMAEAAGIEAPVNRSLYEALLPLEQKARNQAVSS